MSYWRTEITFYQVSYKIKDFGAIQSELIGKTSSTYNSKLIVWTLVEKHSDHSLTSKMNYYSFTLKKKG